MGFEPMTSGLRPAALTTWSNGSLFENGVIKNLMGAMQQKIATFKGENSVWCGTKFLNITKWHNFLDELNLKINDLVKNLMGAMLMKIVILSRGNESHMAKNLVKNWITK